MTEHGYTRKEILEASQQHHELTRYPDFVGIAEEMENHEPWDIMITEDGEHTAEFKKAQKNVHDLINKAADTSEWAVTLGALGLLPQLPLSVAASDPEETTVAFQIATPKEWPDDIKQHLLFEIERAVKDVVNRVLIPKD